MICYLGDIPKASSESFHAKSYFYYLFIDQIYPPARSWRRAEVDPFYRAALKIHKVTKVASGRVCSDAVL